MNTDLGHGFIEVQGIKCYLPPKPDKRQILNYDVKKKDQKWKKIPLPVIRARDVEFWDGSEPKPNDVVSWAEAERQEHIKIYGTDPFDVDKNGKERAVKGVEINPDYSMECLENFRSQELDRLINGVWCYINGDAYYIPGPYYLYLNYWKLQDGPPEFRYTDLELFWFWEHVRKSKNFLGLIYITQRGVGKTSVSACIAYYEAITNRDAWVGIQSKSDDDAGIMFKDKVLLPVSKLPEFLVPIHRNKGKADITRQSQLEFTPPSRGSMDVRLFNKMKDECLYTTMLYRNSGEFAADGVTWKLLLQNEVGKTDPNKVADVYKRLLVNKFTVFRGNKKLGNIFAESSVEDMTVGGAECLQIWKNSDQNNLNANKMTNTGLARFFRSALDATYFDEYGFPDRERSKAWHDVERVRLKSDSKSYISYIQKNPYTVDEAFWINADKCIYNAEILIEAKRKISDSPKPLTIRGDIKWKVKDKEAEFVVNNENGKWYVSYLDFEPNLVQTNNGSRITFTPKAGHKRVMAFDPYVLRTEELSEERKGSQAAATVYSKQDFNTPEDFCDTIIADYVYRHDDPMDSYEDIICACFFFGCPVLIEKNKTNAWDYFRGRGYHWGYEGNENSFIMLRPESTLTDYATKQTSGITSTAVTIQHYVLSTQHHIQNHGHKLKHLRVIDAWLKFNPEKTKDHDLAVAASYSVVASEKVIKSEGRVIDLSTIPAFRTYNNSGSVSQAN